MQKNANRQTSGKASQALSAKAPQEVHGTDVFRRALQKAITRQTYEQARQALAPRPYAETNRAAYLTACLVPLVYRPVSVFLGLVSATMLALGMAGADYSTGVLAYVLAGLFFFALAAMLYLIEVGKERISRQTFRAWAIGGNVSRWLPGLLAVLVGVSVAASAAGGYLLTRHLGDHRAEIAASYQVRQDSVKTVYRSAIAEHEERVALLEKMKADRAARHHWGRLTEQENEDLAFNQDRIVELEHRQAEEVAVLRRASSQEQANTGASAHLFAWVAALLVLACEAGQIASYWYQYHYLKNCEREAVAFNILPAYPSEEAPHSHAPANGLFEEVARYLHFGSEKATSSPASVGSTESVGFKWAGVGDGLSSNKYANLPDGYRICQNGECQKPYLPRHHKQKYCCDDCRKRAWELRHGRKLRPFKPEKAERNS